MAVTRLERKARKNKSRAKDRTLAIKRNVKRLYIKSPYKDESGIILEGDVMSVAAGIAAQPKAVKAEKAAPAMEVEATSVAEVKVVKAPKAENTEKAPKAKKADAGADKLNKIEGIGPKIATVLNEAGITTFAMLADTTPERIREILDNAAGNFAAHDPGTWPKQAALAAAGSWDELKAWQGELNGGK